MTESAKISEYEPFMNSGDAVVQGQSFLTTRGGDVKLGAGRMVTLDPATSYATDWYEKLGADPSRFSAEPPDSLFARARRTTVVDAQGHFKFTGLAPGAYIVRSTVTWETGALYAGQQGGVVGDLIQLKAHEVHELILNKTLSANSLPALLTVEQLKGRQFSKLGQIAGLSCATRPIDVASEDFARNDLQVQAVKAGANAVVNVVCKGGGINWRHNCSTFIECVGDAIRWS
jgi:uncharacterized protein YbjQ (UPF0145 family)